MTDAERCRIESLLVIAAENDNEILAVRNDRRSSVC